MAERYFSRREGKFFIPPPRLCQFQEQFEDVLGGRMEKEEYENSINRTVYFFTGVASNFPFGFSVRYRDYANGSVLDVSPGQGENGSFEIKFDSKRENGLLQKQKIRLDIPYSEKIAVEDLIKAVDALNVEGLDSSLITGILEKIAKDNPCLYPLVAVDYKRDRYRDVDSGKFIATEDNSINFYRFTNSLYIQTGFFNGGILELKETDEDGKHKGDIYRILVDAGAHRFYSKKGHALSLLKHVIKEEMGLKYNELPETEVELKLDINPDLADETISKIYEFYSKGRSNNEIIISPSYPYFDTDSVINYYYHGETDDEERKMSIRLGKYKITTKTLIDRQGPIWIRKEYKGHWEEYNRQKVREEDKGVLSGKAIRNRKSIYLRTPSGRIYKVCVDILEKIPLKKGEKLSQIEIEYAGRLAKYQDTGSESALKKIVSELLVIQGEVTQLLEENGIRFTNGDRKIKMLASN